MRKRDRSRLLFPPSEAVDLLYVYNLLCVMVGVVSKGYEFIHPFEWADL